MGRAAALAGAFALALPAAAPGVLDAARRAPEEPARASAARETRTLQSASTVVFASAPERPHRLVTTFVGADRVRWQLERPGAASPEREVRYRHGENVFVLAQRASSSRALEGDERAQMLAQMELRRAWLGWPAGFEWRDAGGGTRTADLGSGASLRVACASSPSEAARPTEIAELDREGRVRFRYRRLTWTESGGRIVARTAELALEDDLVWTETVETLTTRARFLDAFFLPPDRAPGATSATARVEVVALPAVCGRRVELAAARSSSPWEDATLEIEALIAQSAPGLRERGLELERKATIEVDADLRPVACVLRLTAVPATPPEGFRTTPARRAAALAVDSLGLLRKKHLGLLAKGAPPGTSATPTAGVYVRFDLEAATLGQALLVLPLPSAESR